MASSSHAVDFCGDESRSESVSPLNSPSTALPLFDVECVSVDSDFPSVHRVSISPIDKEAGKVLEYPSILDASRVQQIVKKFFFSKLCSSSHSTPRG